MRYVGGTKSGAQNRTDAAKIPCGPVAGFQPGVSEHGTGRNMAPFVEAEWGTEVWNLMKRLKNAFDPKGP